MTRWRHDSFLNFTDVTFLVFVLRRWMVINFVWRHLKIYFVLWICHPTNVVWLSFLWRLPTSFWLAVTGYCGIEIVHVLCIPSYAVGIHVKKKYIIGFQANVDIKYNSWTQKYIYLYVGKSFLCCTVYVRINIFCPCRICWIL